MEKALVFQIETQAVGQFGTRSVPRQWKADGCLNVMSTYDHLAGLTTTTIYLASDRDANRIWHPSLMTFVTNELRDEYADSVKTTLKKWAEGGGFR